MKTLAILIALFLTASAPDGDIWNLPPLPVEQGPYTESWDTLSRLYNVPQWWRDAKFGAWSHWDPQSAAEYGDWYARGMYMPRNPQYKYHLEHYGHPSEYGYKDLCNDWNTDLWDPEDLIRLLGLRIPALELRECWPEERHSRHLERNRIEIRNALRNRFPRNSGTHLRPIYDRQIYQRQDRSLRRSSL